VVQFNETGEISRTIKLFIFPMAENEIFQKKCPFRLHFVSQCFLTMSYPFLCKTEFHLFYICWKEILFILCLAINQKKFIFFFSFRETISNVFACFCFFGMTFHLLCVWQWFSKILIPSLFIRWFELEVVFLSLKNRWNFVKTS
jgi:hypothetical protein